MKTTEKLKKFEIDSIGNDGDFNFYVFNKKQNIIEKLSKIIYEVFEVNSELEKIYNEKNKIYERKKNWIKYYKDEHKSIDDGGENFRIDIFFGDKKMFLTIHCSQKLRLKFNEILFKISFMSKGKKFKPIEK